MFSPDGHWIAYDSNESGFREVYVRPFPAGGGGRWQISVAGGRSPVWSRSGGELYFESLDRRIMAAAYTVKGDSFSAAKPRVWCDRQVYSPNLLASSMEPSRDGKRFMVLPGPDLKGGNTSVHATMLLNFVDEVKRKIP